MWWPMEISRFITFNSNLNIKLKTPSNTNILSENVITNFY